MLKNVIEYPVNFCIVNKYDTYAVHVTIIKIFFVSFNNDIIMR